MSSIADAVFADVFFIIVAVMFIRYKKTPALEPVLYKLIYYQTLLLMAIAGADTLSRFMHIWDGDTPSTLGFVCTTLLCFIQPLFWMLTAFVVDYWNYRSKPHMLRWVVPAVAFCIAEEIVVLINVLTKDVFSFGDTGFSIYGPYFIQCLALYGCHCLVLAAGLFLGWVQAETPEARRRAHLLIDCALLPIAGLAYTALGGTAPLLWPLTGVGILMARMDFQQLIISRGRYERLKEEARITGLELELKKQSVSVMLSQVRPHFLFNALSAIRVLCVIDPPKAEEGVIQFSTYLRGNLRGVGNEIPERIPFTEELEHIKSYIALEQLRFMDRLHVELDIRTTDFMVPPLGIQPFVENAVRYGVTQRQEGGTVKLSTCAEDDNWVITILDDGVGADPYITHFDGHPKLGLDAAEERLSLACNATITVDALPGIGTNITIKLPRKEDNPT